MAGDWPRSFFWRFHGSRLRLALLTSRLVNNAYMIILRCLSNVVKENERTTNKAKSIFVLEIFKYFPSKLSTETLLEKNRQGLVVQRNLAL